MKEQFWLERWQRQLRSDKAQYGSSVFHASAGCLFSSGPTWSLPKDCLMFSMRESSSLNNRLSDRLFFFFNILRYRSAHGGDSLMWRTRTFEMKKQSKCTASGISQALWCIYDAFTYNGLTNVCITPLWLEPICLLSSFPGLPVKPQTQVIDRQVSDRQTGSVSRCFVTSCFFSYASVLFGCHVKGSQGANPS